MELRQRHKYPEDSDREESYLRERDRRGVEGAQPLRGWGSPDTPTEPQHTSQSKAPANTPAEGEDSLRVDTDDGRT